MNNTIFTSKLNNLKFSLNQNTLNLKSIRQQIIELQKFKDVENYNYLNGLLYPRENKGCKIPSQIPIPSCSFQLRSTFRFSPSNYGNFLGIINPFFLYDIDALGKTYSYTFTYSGVTKTINMQSKDFSTYFFGRGDSIGITENKNLYLSSRDINQGIPGVYDQYRLVSAELDLSYAGPIEEATGTIGGAIVYNQKQTIGAHFRNITDSSPAEIGSVRYGNEYFTFQSIRDEIYSTENSALSGLRLLYFPVDNRYENYIKLFDGTIGSMTQARPDLNRRDANAILNPSYFNAGFNWIFYVQNGSKKTNSYRVDLYCNFECLPTAKMMNYCPVSTCNWPLKQKERKDIIDKIKESSVQKLIK